MLRNWFRSKYAGLQQAKWVQLLVFPLWKTGVEIARLAEPSTSAIPTQLQGLVRGASIRITKRPSICARIKSLMAFEGWSWGLPNRALWYQVLTIDAQDSYTCVPPRIRGSRLVTKQGGLLWAEAKVLEQVQGCKFNEVYDLLVKGGYTAMPIDLHENFGNYRGYFVSHPSGSHSCILFFTWHGPHRRVYHTDCLAVRPYYPMVGPR